MTMTNENVKTRVLEALATGPKTDLYLKVECGGDYGVLAEMVNEALIERVVRRNPYQGSPSMPSRPTYRITKH